jgi:hypothetical protein
LVNCEFEGIVEHPRNEFAEQRTRTFETRIFVDLDEPHLQLPINDEIEAEDFEAELPLVLVDLFVD